nr:hypothetical protein [Tanacetum cinerariifolium]
MNELEQIKKGKEGLDSKLTGFESASKDLDTLLGRKTWPKNNVAHKNVTPRADLFKTAPVSAAWRINTAAPRPNVNNARPKTTQDLVIKLIQRVNKLEKELKARTLPTKIQNVDVKGRSRSIMAWVPKKCVFPLPVMKISLLEYFATVSEKEFSLLEYFATTSEEVFPLLSY